jgi:hypothetical protein
MKIKTDFVTNSSTTSFVVIGLNINASDIPEDYVKAAAEKKDTTVETMKEDTYDLLESLLHGSDLSYAFPEYGDPMVGIRYSNMDDDETLREFKSRVRLQILETLGITNKPYHIEEAWRDG